MIYSLISTYAFCSDECQLSLEIQLYFARLFYWRVRIDNTFAYQAARTHGDACRLVGHSINR